MTMNTNKYKEDKIVKKPIRFLAFFLCFVLLFSFCLTPSALNGDIKFLNYINMEEKGAENGYKIPNLFRQDAVYSNMSKFPLVVYGGEEYVPMSMFILYSYVEVKYSKTTDNFFLLNEKNNHYVSVNVAENVASTHNGELLQMTTRIFNKTRYIPARAVANVLGFVCESYDDQKNGIYSFRISDGRSTKTLEDLIKPYIDMYLGELVVKEDPIDKVASRTVSLCYSNFESEHTPRILASMKTFGIKASFAVTKNDVIDRSDLVREAYCSGHGLVVTADASGETAEEYTKSFIENLEEANKALKFVIKKKTRLCIPNENAPAEFIEGDIFKNELAKAGYVLVTANTETGDSVSYTGSAYAISSKIKNKITSGFDENKRAVVTAILYCSANTQYYSADVASLVNRYEQFSFSSMNEGLLILAKEN